MNGRDLTIFASPVLKTGVQAFIQDILLACKVRVFIGYPPTETKTVVRVLILHIKLPYTSEKGFADQTPYFSGSPLILTGRSTLST